MNWENSKAATPIKRDFLRAWFQEDQRFFLTGGSALGIFYLHHRYSYDLDLFTDQDVSTMEIRNLILRTATKIEAHCETLQTSPDFHRFQLQRGDEREIIDIVIDRAPQLEPVKNLIDGIRVDTIREIIANKLTTLVSRSEIKDLVDLYYLEKEGYDLLAAIPDARAKDGGWEPAIVSMLLNGIEITTLPEWLIRDLELQDLQDFLQRLRLATAELALPE